MRWNKQDKPSIGHKRYVFKVALLPTEMTDGTMVWLEKYYEKQEFKETLVYVENAFSPFVAMKKWVTIEKSAID